MPSLRKQVTWMARPKDEEGLAMERFKWWHWVSALQLFVRGLLGLFPRDKRNKWSLGWVLNYCAFSSPSCQFMVGGDSGPFVFLTHLTWCPALDRCFIAGGWLDEIGRNQKEIKRPPPIVCRFWEFIAHLYKQSEGKNGRKSTYANFLHLKLVYTYNTEKTSKLQHPAPIFYDK